MIFKCNVSTTMLKVMLFKVINARYGIILRGNLSPPILHVCKPHCFQDDFVCVAI